MHPLRVERARFRGLLAGACTVLAVTACDGPNFFSGTALAVGGTGQGPSVDIEAPRGDSLTAKPLGDSLLVRARVRDASGLARVVFKGVALRGDAQLGTDDVVSRYEAKTVVLAGARDTILTRFLLATADTTKETAHIIVEATSLDGFTSSDTTRITLGGPSVELLNLESGQAVQSGLALSLQLRASDPQGIISVEFEITGAFEANVTQSFNPPPDSVRVDTAVVIPAGTTGSIDVLARARNSLDVAGQDGPVRLTVTAGGATDVSPPSLSMTIASPDRLGARDSLQVQVTGSDDSQGSGVQRVGVTVEAFSPSRGVTETLVFSQDYQTPRTGSVTQTIGFEPFNIDPRELPDTLIFEITGFLVDAAGNCAATVADDQRQSLECATGAGGAVTAEGRSGFRLTRSVVAGRTVTLPAGGLIMDAAVDSRRRNLLLSNILRDRVEVFRLQTEEFSDFVPVGSEPWGLALNRDGDTLLVANSGGTNVTAVFLGPDDGQGPAAEVPGSRFLTPDVLLFDVERTEDSDGFTRFNVFIIPDASPPAFSDRPQFLVQDFTGRVLYSTKTNSVGNIGTIRKAFVPDGGVDPEVLLFWEHGALLPADDFVGVANADDVTVIRLDLGDLVTVDDHVPGFRDMPITGGPDTPADAVDAVVAAGSDAVAVPGRFSITNIGFTDTTFVGLSGDRRWGVFGEGSIEIGRVIMYDAESDVISGVVPVSDLMTNAAESVRGVGLNYDGTLGVARGIGAYFFTRDLRLQGVADLPAGGAGAALHPLHANARSLDNTTGEYRPDTHLAFVGTGERTIDIVDTFHFFRSGRIFTRDVVKWAATCGPPLPGGQRRQPVCVDSSDR